MIKAILCALFIAISFANAHPVAVNLTLQDNKATFHLNCPGRVVLSSRVEDAFCRAALAEAAKRHIQEPFSARWIFCITSRLKRRLDRMTDAMVFNMDSGWKAPPPSSIEHLVTRSYCYLQ